MVKNTSKKRGFSLVEALTSMLIISVFFVVMSKTITTKPKTETFENHHGFYECYMLRTGDTDGPMYETRRDDLVQVDTAEVTECKMEPTKGIAYASLYVMGARDVDAQSLFQRVYMHNIIQFTNGFTISKEGLKTFRGNYMPIDNSEEDMGDLISWDLFNYLQKTYPRSGLYEALKELDEGELLEDRERTLYAVFICW